MALAKMVVVVLVAAAKMAVVVGVVTIASIDGTHQINVVPYRMVPSEELLYHIRFNLNSFHLV